LGAWAKAEGPGVVSGDDDGGASGKGDAVGEEEAVFSSAQLLGGRFAVALAQAGQF